MFALAILGRAQPAIRQNGVVNSASRIPPGLAGGAIARGALFTIYGVRFGSPGPVQVTVSAAGRSVEAQILSTTADRIDAKMPASAPLGNAALTVTVDGMQTAPFLIEIAAENPGLFSRNRLGWGPGRIENIASGKRSDNSILNPARAGQRVALFGTGFGNEAGITVLVGARATKAARSAASGNTDKIEFSVPTDVAAGCYVPVYVLASPVRASNVVTISIRDGAGPCRRDPMPVLDAGTVGVAVVSRTRIRPRNETADSIDDEAVVAFASASDRPLSPLLLLPPPGTCTAYTSTLQDDAALPNSISSALASLIAGRGLDAGPQLTIRGAGQSRQVIRVNSVPGYYRGRLGQSGPNTSRRASPLFLDPGEFTVAGLSGKDVGTFNAAFAAPLPFEWNDDDSLPAIDRSRPLALHWREAPRGSLIVILATNLDQVTTATGTSLCVADGGAGRFTIPPAILANLPASKDTPGARHDQLLLSSIAGQPAAIHASGLENSAVVALYTIGRFVRYR
jgi:uncharacterized protein (TIGR03437 family)